ncbi:MAG: tetratricopeptide repeat protein [Nitrospirae bacterium]|nr:tetratricopeptide repeat protein [Nitrospirota bacterium]
MAFSKNRFLQGIIVLNIILPISSLAYAEPVHIPSLLLSLHVDGDPFTIWFDKGRILYKQMAYKEAAEAFSNISKTAGNAPQDIIDETMYMRANSLMKIGDYAEALRVADSIPNKSFFYPFSLYTKALISLNTDKEKAAIEYLEQVSKNIRSDQQAKDKQTQLIEGLALRANITLGFIYLEGNNPGEAIRHFSAVPKNSPFYEQALFGMGWAYTSMDRWVRSVVFWEELSYLYPESVYTREVIPYIGYAYTKLNAYGKALEQNGVALHYYEGLMKKIPLLKGEIKQKNVERITDAINLVGNKELMTELDSYKGFMAMEEYLGQVSAGITFDAETLMKNSKKVREEIIEDISRKLTENLDRLQDQLLESAVNTSLAIAHNLRLEGGGEISNDMVFE